MIAVGKYGPSPVNVVERILHKTVYDHGCWLFTGAKSQKGYGVVSRPPTIDGAKQSILAHRIIFEDEHGPIADGLELDHLCRNTMCCNPLHLEAVTHLENMARSSTSAARKRRAALQTHCKHGHELSGANLGINSAGNRYCRYCHKESMKAVNARTAVARRKNARTAS